jgi:lipoate-protein ligase A
VDREAVEHYGFGLVRRLTGGRAVLHQHELTYSVVAPEGAEQVSGGVVESYRKISTALVEGLRALGAEVDLAPPNRELRLAQIEARAAGEAANGDPSHAVCFDAASDYELTAGGRKLVGSAQARRAGVVLQHGSILLDIDWDAWANVFAYRTPEGRARAAAKLRTRMTSLSEQLGRPISPGEVAGALAEAFARHFHVDLTPGTMAEPELAAAATLAAGKYSDESWTARK